MSILNNPLANIYIVNTTNGQQTRTNNSSIKWILNQLKDPNHDSSLAYVASNYDELKDLTLTQYRNISADTVKDFTKLRDNVSLNFRISRTITIPNAITIIKNVLKDNGFVNNYVVYPTSSTASVIEFQFITFTNRLINSQQADYILKKYVTNIINLPLAEQLPRFQTIYQTDKFDNDINIPNGLTENDYAFQNNIGQTITITQKELKANHLIPEKDSKKKKTENKPTFDEKYIHKAIDTWLAKDNTINEINSAAAREKLMASLAIDHWNNVYPKSTPNIVITGIAKKLNIDADRLTIEYRKQLSYLAKNNDERQKVTDIGEYLKLYQQNDSRNMGARLVASIGDDFKPNSKMELDTAATFIESMYPPYIVKNSSESDVDSLVIFDPTSGAWVHDENIFQSLLNGLRRMSTKRDCETLMIQMATDARNHNQFIEPYHGSQYLLFKNCVLDAYTLKQYRLDSDFTKQKHFTERHMININYLPMEQIPMNDIKKFGREKLTAKIKDKNGNLRYGDWTPWNFINAYGANDPERIQFVYFCLSLGLFAGHNFGIHVSIQGTTRWGKTTLAEIFKNLFPNRVFTTSFNKLNEPFSFTSYQANTSLIWIDECNVDAHPLDDDTGTPLYDTLANTTARLNVKHHGDKIISNPPQMFIDGTSFVRAKQASTGPAGRTLALALPSTSDAPQGQNENEFIQKLHEQSYGTGINDLLGYEPTLQYLVDKMIEAYEHTLRFKTKDHQDPRLNDLILNLGRSSDLNLLPKFAVEWHDKMQDEQGSLGSWFDDNFADALKHYKNKQEAGTNDAWMCTDLAYDFYKASYEEQNTNSDPNDRYIIHKSNFKLEFENLLKNRNWHIVYTYEKNGTSVKRHTSHNFDSTAIDLAKVNDPDSSIKMPKNYQDVLGENGNPRKALPYPFNNRSRHWYQLFYYE